jgi:opacity protein-like surface antigen
MKKNALLFRCFFLFIFCGLILSAGAQKFPKAKKVKPDKEQTEDFYDDDDPFEEKLWKKSDSWQRKGFEFFICGGTYFASSKTARYYNGAPYNNINLDLLFKNQYHRDTVRVLLKNVYPYIDNNFEVNVDYEYKTRYNVAMDVALGVKYRFTKNFYLELSYSFRRLTAQKYFDFRFPGGIDGNKENPPYSKRQSLVAKEDRHYIDLSVGYVFHLHPIAKPFLAVGAHFNYIELKQFFAAIEGENFDLISIAKYPDHIPGVQQMPNYRVWSGPGYGLSLTAGLKIAINSSVSLDPVFQMSIGSFGNSRNLPNFNTTHCFNFMAGIRIVMCDAMFVTFGKKSDASNCQGGSCKGPEIRIRRGGCRGGSCTGGY